MPRERPEYRDNYEALLDYFGMRRRLLTARDVAEFCGRDQRTVKKIYDIPKEGITIATLARRMCG